MKDLEPITREETMLAKVAGQDVPTLEPVTREEYFLAKAAGQDVPELEPVTRKEYFLADVIEAIESGGGGSDLGTKAISANGTYKATDDDLDGYSKVTVNVPASAVDSGTKNISSNGLHDVTGYESASVSVPNSYVAGDEGKVVSNGALVSQTSDTVTENDTYDTTTISSLTVNVSGGGGDSVAAVMKTIGYECFRYMELPETLIFPSVTRLDARCFGGATGLKILVLPVVNTMVTYPLSDNTVIQTIDFGANTPTFDNYTFSGDSSLTTLILRKTSDVIALGNISAFNNSPFRSGGSGGTIYVPSSLISTYQSATNWSTINGYGTITWKAIEGSEYETHYADGTVIS
jgi:hypothetical protein